MTASDMPSELRQAIEDEARYFEVAYGDTMGMSGNFVAQRFRKLLTLPQPAGRDEGWQPINTWSLKQHGRHVTGWHPTRFGVSEYCYYDDGGWHVAAFNGLVIKQAPHFWQPMPAAPITANGEYTGSK